AALKRYFEGISRVRTVTEPVGAGRMDRYGHEIMEQRPVKNLRGEIVTVTEFVEPPTVGGLCAALEISRATWMRYHEGPTAAAAAWADDVLRTWNERELLTREGRNLQGVIFNLQNNYGYAGKIQAPDGGGGAVEEIMGAISFDTGDGRFE
ncbi:MAG: hypothetical protein IJ705_08235, partial [Oscillospiraceae bacterium]|nr:hypothetical protein [Oscillospiraceae bacterium]